MCAAKEAIRKDIAPKDVVVCPQLPSTSPRQLNRGAWAKPPMGWTCAPELYYQLDCPVIIDVTCDCGVFVFFLEFVSIVACCVCVSVSVSCFAVASH